MRLLDLLSTDWVQRLGWMLLHSLWQLAVVAAVVTVLLWRLRRRSAEVRYWVSCGGLMVEVLLPLTTALWVQPRTTLTPQPVEAANSSTSAPAAARTGGAEAGGAEAAASASDAKTRTAAHRRTSARRHSAPPTLADHLTNAILPWLPQIVAVWLAGVTALGLWHFGGWLMLVRLRRTAAGVCDTAIVQRLEALAGRMRIGRRVRLLVSAAVESPLTFGWLRPVILVPAAVLTGLSPDQLDAILAHELAHIRRYDYLVNLLQTAVETAFFYHPGVWWISRQIRIEREHCCDDDALAVCGNAVTLARALASLEESRRAVRLQLAAAGTMGAAATLDRVRRVLGLTSTHVAAGQMRTWVGGVLTGLALSASLSGSAADRYWEHREFLRLAEATRAYQPDYASTIESMDIDDKTELLRLIRPAVFLQENGQGEGPLGATRVGGQPDLPPDIAWPTWKGKHQPFVAQVDLADLPSVPGREALPSHGRLYFFYALNCDPASEIPYGDSKAEEGAAPVFYSDAPVTTLVRQPYPQDIEPEQKFSPRPLRPAVFNTVPDFEHPVWRQMSKEDDEFLPLVERWDALEKNRPDPHFQMLGHHMPMQTSVGLDIESVFSRPKEPEDAMNEHAAQWELLFQSLDLFGDCSLYYVIRRDDLLHHRWNKAWFCVQAT